MFIWIVLFAVAVTGLAFTITGRHAMLDRAQLAAYIVMIAWGAMLFGLFMERFARPAAMLFTMTAR
ncbi:MAG: hypothetical protein M0Z79_11415 [Nitrospiraceae bacterium]|nr:hypothetical protein [Nitrospiraceae bacterium]